MDDPASCENCAFSHRVKEGALYCTANPPIAHPALVLSDEEDDEKRKKFPLKVLAWIAEYPPAPMIPCGYWTAAIVNPNTGQKNGVGLMRRPAAASILAPGPSGFR